MSNLRVAVHKLEIGGPKDRTVVLPDSLVVLSDKDLADMEALGAVREPTKAEAALHAQMEKNTGGGRGRGRSAQAAAAADAGEAAAAAENGEAAAADAGEAAAESDIG